MEETLVIIKPEIVREKKVGTILSYIEDLGKIEKMKIFTFSPEEASLFYSLHKDKDFFPDLIKYISSGPVVALVLSGEGIIERMRRRIGPTDPDKASFQTIRGIFGKNIQENAIHASESREKAEEEISLIFGERK